MLQWYDHADSMDFYHQFIAVVVEAKIKLVKLFSNAQKKIARTSCIWGICVFEFGLYQNLRQYVIMLSYSI